MNKSTTLLVHGFNVKDGGIATVQTMEKHFKALSNQAVFNWNYGHFNLMNVIFQNKKVAKKIKDYVGKIEAGKSIYAVGHSNGCAILVNSARQGARYDKLLLINPALKVDTVFPKNIGQIIVVHTNNDKPTNVAGILDKIPFLCLAIPNAWGAMCKVGYQGKDKRVTNLDMTSVLKGHSDFFSGKNNHLKNLMVHAVLNSTLPRELGKFM